MREMGRCCQHFRDPESQVDKAMGKVEVGVCVGGGRGDLQIGTEEVKRQH